jgi:hypothetical protein
VSCPPHRHPRLYLSEQVEALRIGLGQAQAHTVVLVPTVVPGRELERGLRLAREHGGAPGTVLAGTDLPGAPDRPPEDVRVVVGSRRGRDLLAAYGRQLSHEVQLLAADPPAEGS